MIKHFCLLLICLVASTASASVLRIVVDDTIQPASAEYIARAIDHAALQRSAALLIELRTPGGLEESMRTIVEKIVHSSVPVIVYVSPSGGRAASAGFVILESADIAAMAPGTNTGAAHPVLLGQKMDDVMKTKLENDSAAFMRSIAAKRGRNVTVAESAIRQSRSFTEQEALHDQLIDVISTSPAALLRSIDGRVVTRFDGTRTTLRLDSARMFDYEMTLRERLLSGLMNPNVVFILFILGALALYVEFNHPGAVVPGVVGAVALLVSAVAMNLLPIRFAALALLIGAFILFALEAKFASHGIFGAGGVACLVLGGLFLVDGPVPELRVDLLTTLAVAIPISAIAIGLATLAFRARKNRVVTGQEGMIGQAGVARTNIADDGKVFVHGELWNATSSTPIESGAAVRVDEVDGLRVRVSQI